MASDSALFEWDAVVSPFDRTAMIQILLAIGIPFGVLLVLLALFGGTQAKYAAGLILAVLIVAAITAYAVLRKKYVRFAVFDDRIERIDLPRSVRTAEKLKEYTVVAGVFSSSLTTVATGILMQTQDHTSIKWRSVTSAEMYSNRIRIICKGNEMTIPCTDELCARLAETIGENVAEHKIVSKE